MLLLGGMLLLNVYMRTKQSATKSTSSILAAEAERRALVKGGPGAAANLAKKNSARIEEITEGEINVDQKKSK